MNDDRIYERLRRHLDRQAIGFPASRNGADLRLLRHIFTPREALIAACLQDRYEPLPTIFERAQHLVANIVELGLVLDNILRKGGIEAVDENGQRLYSNTPLVVGMYELQVGRLSPTFIHDFKTYTSSFNFGLEFLGTALPQMRTIPVAKSIQPHHRARHFDEIAALLRRSEGPFVILECICRKKKRMEGETCKVTARRETCLGIGPIAQTVLHGGLGRCIDRGEALAIIEANQKEGLVMQPANSESPAFVCSCCGCCCGMLQLHRRLPKPVDFWSANFYAQVNAAACNGCGLCRKRCQVGAVDIPGRGRPARVDLNRCLGCGHCAAACARDAIALKKKPVEIRPPRDRRTLHDILKANRNKPWRKAAVVGKLAMDTLRTRDLRLFKR